MHDGQGFPLRCSGRMWSTGAPPKPEACRCNMEHKCCEVYEHCVSCCQAPQHSNASLLLEVFRGPDR